MKSPMRMLAVVALTGCGPDKGDPDTVVIQGSGAPNVTQYSLAFHRLTR